ncbi:hypothetical protein Thiowin_01230 [Thiorhodovibrio winogradskyi]|uniref:Uncharacterized protein n=1 Tax=Thiorhodovibrio winogradskyi TaxID=77007 RepID=A0ABZ0S5L8_9GAMM|nr:hypothetical protein [Thiorhodovibrio winogradskyi]
MPTFVGLGFTLVGVWFLFQAFSSRREALERQAAEASTSQASGLTEHHHHDSPAHDNEAQNNQAHDHQVVAEALVDSQLTAEQHRHNRELQKFASGCAPVVAIGVVLMALGVSAIALMMNLTMKETMDRPGLLSIFDIVSILFFAGAFAYSLLTRTYYSTVALTESKPNHLIANSPDNNNRP